MPATRFMFPAGKQTKRILERDSPGERPDLVGPCGRPAASRRSLAPNRVRAAIFRWPTMAKRVGGSTATNTRPSGWHFGQLGAVLMLDAVAPYIDSWAIVDTGSDEGTQGNQDLIRNHMAGRGIPGGLHQRPGVM